MTLSHFTFAFRNMIRNRTFTAINTGGLLISLTAFILMCLYIENELSFDTFHSKAGNIYRVVDDKISNGLMQHTAMSSAPVAPSLLKDFPQIKQAARLIKSESLVKNADRIFEERDMYYADGSIFKIFDFRLLKGNPANALMAPNSIVISEQGAVKYFGNSEPLGKTLLLDGNAMKVTGIMQPIPGNSHLGFDFLISMSSLDRKNSGYDWMFTNWYSNNFYTYILLSPGVDAGSLVKQFDAFAARNQANTATTTHHYALEKLTDIYLHSDRENQPGKTGSLTNLYIFSSVAVFIIFIACINFVNLSTARANERAKEVAIKKVNGVKRRQLVYQFFVESFLMVGIAELLALACSFLVLPLFNQFARTNIVFNLFTFPHLLSLFLIFAVVGFLSGIYPAIFLSGFNPITALKGNLKTAVWDVVTRKGLVVFQFAVSVVLIIGSLVVFSQLRFMQNHELGFQPAQTMVINFEGDRSVLSQYGFIKSELMKVNGVKSITSSSNVPGDLSTAEWSMDFAKKTGDTVNTALPIFLTDFNFLEQYNIPVVAGRGFSNQYAADTMESMIINETALSKLGFNNAAEAMGVKVGMYPSDGKIIGVFKDFHFESLQKKISPLAMRVLPAKVRKMSVQVNTSNLGQTIAGIEKVWKNTVPQRPLSYNFLDQAFDEQYNKEMKFGQLFSIFSLLAIVIACFGLFGLALFSVRQRRKEIGIRKIIGASVGQITVLLSKDFILLVMIAILAGSPVAYYFMYQWLQSFAYRISIHPWMFLIAGFLSVLTALATISYLAVKAAIVNPVNNLRSE